MLIGGLGDQKSMLVLADCLGSLMIWPDPWRAGCGGGYLALEGGF